MRLSKFRAASLLCMLLLLAGAVITWRWYARFNRFPVNRLPRWEIFESWRISSTRQYLFEATQAVGAFEAHYGKLPFNSPNREYQGSITLGHDLSGIWTDIDRRNRDRLVFWNLPAGEQRDGWGNLLHYHFDHDGDGIVHPGVQPVHHSFVVWSSGPNGHDDGGEGDDIRGW